MPLAPLLANLEQNIASEISVDRMADAALLSRSQLYREFYNATGHSVKEYVRKRRLHRRSACHKAAALRSSPTPPGNMPYWRATAAATRLPTKPCWRRG